MPSTSRTTSYRLAPGFAFIPTRQSRGIIIVERGQRWRTRDKRRPNFVIEILDKIDGRAFYRLPDGELRFLDCDDLRRRFTLEADA